MERVCVCVEDICLMRGHVLNGEEVDGCVVCEQTKERGETV